MEPRELLRSLFDAAIEAATPRPSWFEGLPKGRGRIVVVGAGKAAAEMARAFERANPGPVEGIVVTRRDHGCACERIEVIEAGHPLPDEAGLDAARRIVAIVSGLRPEDRVVSLMSGGGSALLAMPVAGISLAEKREVTRALLLGGATIHEINAVRRRLSAVKGGRLLAACRPASVATFVASDVAGDDPAVVASGPTLPPPADGLDPVAIVRRCGVEPSAAVRTALLEPLPEVAPHPGDSVAVVATARSALEAAAAHARSLGVSAHVLSDRIEGEARDIAREHARIALAAARGDGPFRAPCVLLSGGEATVAVRGGGRGGPNAEFAAAFAEAVRGAPEIHALAADTDGLDGAGDAAGAFVDPSTVERAGDRLAAALDENDAHGLFARLGDGLVTGPTRTNVNDFRAILILPEDAKGRLAGPGG